MFINKINIVHIIWNEFFSYIFTYLTFIQKKYQDKFQGFKIQKKC